MHIYIYVYTHLFVKEKLNTYVQSPKYYLPWSISQSYSFIHFKDLSFIYG